jgi:hypothetical protein
MYIFVKCNTLTYRWIQNCTYCDLVCEDFNSNQHTNTKISQYFPGDGRSMHNDVNNTKRNKQKTTNIVKLIRSVPVNNTSSCSTPPQLNSGPQSPSLLLWRHVMFYKEMLSAPRAKLNLTDQFRVFMATETRWPSYAPRHWVARDLGSATSPNHSNCDTLRSVGSTVGGK